MCVREASVVTIRGAQQVLCIYCLGSRLKKNVAEQCWSPLGFSQPPTAALPTQARRGRGRLEEEHINTLEHVSLSVYGVLWLGGERSYLKVGARPDIPRAGCSLDVNQRATRAATRGCFASMCGLIN